MKYSRKEIWQHNGFLGTCAFASKGLQAIVNSRTASPHAKAKASHIIGLLDELAKALKVKA